VLFRKGLVGFQFIIAAVVLISSVIVSQQVELFFSKNIGFNKDYLIYAQVPRDWSAKGVQKMEAIRYQLSQMPEVKDITLSYDIPYANIGGENPIYRQGTDPKNAITTQILTTDNRYAATYSIPLKAGAFFTGNYLPADSTKLVINETAAKALGWKNPQDAIGQLVNIPAVNSPCTIYGVTSDFHFDSMQNKISPVVFLNVNFSTGYRFFSIKLKPGDAQKSITSLQKKWGILLPAAPFEYHFVDDALAHIYKSELQLKKASLIATVLAIAIVLLGILGLVSLSIQKRTKEIGIRKVLGSSVPAIIALFIKEFFSVVIIAALVASPLTWLIMNNWLRAYAYRITISGYPFIVSIVLLGLLTVILITLQTIKAAINNPVKSLRAE
jgi:putative ABC transport system permease protein